VAEPALPQHREPAEPAQLIGIYGIYAIGLGLVIITGGIDLSVGSVTALLSVILALALREWGWHWGLAVAAVVAGGALLGCFHGALITRVRLQPFIVTLCGFLFYRGIARFIANDETQGFGSEQEAASQGYDVLKSLATTKIFGIPPSFVLPIIIAVVMGIVLHRSVWGRHLFAVGRNEDAARYSGINSRRVIAMAYVLCSMLAAVAAILDAFYTNSISASDAGGNYELYAIAAVLGGCSLRGGEGSIIGILIGTSLLQVLRNLINLLGIPSSLDFAVTGVVILLGVLDDQLLQSRARKKTAVESKPADPTPGSHTPAAA
jgi:ribose transport system permease protein